MSKARATVLVIDDEADLREMLAFELAQEGFEVTAVEGGEAAVAASKQRKFDLAVTDLMMPGMNGIDTVAALKGLDPAIEVIVATGYATVETAIECMKRGAYDYIRKPYDLDEIRMLLERALEKSRLQGNLTLYEASRELLGTLNHADLVGGVVDLALRLLRADAGGLVLQDPAEYRSEIPSNGCGAPLRPPATGGFRTGSKPQIHAGGSAPPPSEALLRALCGQSLDAGAALGFPGAAQAPPPELAGERFSSAIVQPLVVRGHVLGALALLRRQPSPAFGETELQRATVFAAELAMALDNARLYGALDEKIRELLATRDQLIQAEKLGLAGKLAGGVAHEINNPLSFVLTNLDTLKGCAGDVRALWAEARAASAYLGQASDPAARDLARRLAQACGGEGRAESLVKEIGDIVGESIDGAQRIADLVAGFNRLAGMGDAAPLERLDVGAMVEECLTEVSKKTAGEGAIMRELRCRPVAMGTKADVRTGILNVLSFALDKSRHGGAPGEQRPLAVHVDVEEGRPCVCVSMPSIALSAEERAHLFDPRLDVDTTHGRRMRLDIGLALAHQLLARAGGQLILDDRASGELVFRIRLTPAV